MRVDKKPRCKKCGSAERVWFKDYCQDCNNERQEKNVSLGPVLNKPLTEAQKKRKRIINYFSTLIGVALFLSVTITGFAWDGSARCSDGWNSSSIGRQGACSHHGGVRDSLKFPILIGSAFLGLWGYAFTYGKLEGYFIKRV